jgi:hypothetical protein
MYLLPTVLHESWLVQFILYLAQSRTRNELFAFKPSFVFFFSLWFAD